MTEGDVKMAVKNPEKVIAALEEELEFLEAELKTVKDELKQKDEALICMTKKYEKAAIYNEDLRQKVESLEEELASYKTEKKPAKDVKTKEPVVESKPDTTGSANSTDSDVPMTTTTEPPTASDPLTPGLSDNATIPGLADTTAKLQPDTAVPTAAAVQQPAADPAAQTNADWGDPYAKDKSQTSLADSIRQTATDAMHGTGYVFDESSAMYYNHNTGYYYDSTRQLYYNPSTYTYYYYDHTSQTYVFHSQLTQADMHQYNIQTGAPITSIPTITNPTPAPVQIEPRRRTSGNYFYRNDSGRDRYEGRERVQYGDVMDRDWRRRYDDRDAADGVARSRDHTPEDGYSSRSRKHDSKRKYDHKSSKRKRHDRDRSYSPFSDSDRETSSKKHKKKSKHKRERRESDKSDKDKKRDEKKVVKNMLDGVEKKKEEKEKVNGEDKEDKEKSEQSGNEGVKKGENEENKANGPDMEEGELTSSSSAGSRGSSLSKEGDQGDNKMDTAEKDGGMGDQEITQHYAPCIRAMVLKSDKLSEGTLFIVTCTGATLGRDKGLSHVILIPDVNVSKMHCSIVYEESLQKYLIKDHASQNGTFVNGTRLSKAKVMSDSVSLQNGDILKVANTTFSLHIHPGTETCCDCEPGVVQAKIQEEQSKDVMVLNQADKDKIRKSQLKQIKKKYGLQNANYVENKEGKIKEGYEDKAEKRRATVGSDNPYQKDDAPASVDKAIASDNKGHKMLAKMGWKEGDTLGKGTMQGLAEPIQINIRTKQAGLGTGSHRSMDDAATQDPNEKWHKAQQRYKDIDTSQSTGLGAPQQTSGSLDRQDTDTMDAEVKPAVKPMSFVKGETVQETVSPKVEASETLSPKLNAEKTVSPKAEVKEELDMFEIALTQSMDAELT